MSIIAKQFQWATSPRTNGGLRCRGSFSSVLLLLYPLHTHSCAVSHTLRYPCVLPSAVRFSPLLRRRFPRFFGSMSSLNSSNQGDVDQISYDVKTVRVVIKGIVQGVFYRNWTIDNAKELGLKGWVRNRRDGSVEALISGPTDKVQEMEQRCRLGPPDAMVTGLQVFPSSDDPGSDFERKPTV